MPVLGCLLTAVPSELFTQPKKEELEIAVGVSITKIYGEMENKRRVSCLAGHNG